MFPVIWVLIVTGATCGTPDFTSFGEFMISSIHYILLNLSVLGLCLRMNARITLTALSPIYFIRKVVVKGRS